MLDLRTLTGASCRLEIQLLSNALHGQIALRPLVCLLVLNIAGSKEVHQVIQLDGLFLLRRQPLDALEGHVTSTVDVGGLGRWRWEVDGAEEPGSFGTPRRLRPRLE